MGDIFESDFSTATVVSLFPLQELNLRRRPTLLAMRPGTRIVSNTFDMGEWRADSSVTRTPDCVNFCTAYQWTVPAQAQGAWRLGAGELSLDQSFQRLDGFLRTGTDSQPLADARLDGMQIRTSVGANRYVGEVRGDRMTGRINDGAPREAIRIR